MKSLVHQIVQPTSKRSPGKNLDQRHELHHTWVFEKFCLVETKLEPLLWFYPLRVPKILHSSDHTGKRASAKTGSNDLRRCFKSDSWQTRS